MQETRVQNAAFEETINQLPFRSYASQFSIDMKQLQDDILNLYYDLFIYECFLLFINAFYIWNANLTILAIILLVLKIVGTYISCKQQPYNPRYQNRIINAIDTVFQALYLLHILLYLNSGVSLIYVSSIILFVQGTLFLFIKIKQFIFDQPFFKIYLLTNMVELAYIQIIQVYWITRFFFQLSLILISEIIETKIFSKLTALRSLERVYFYLLIILLGYILITLCYDLYNRSKFTNRKRFILFRGQALIILLLLQLSFSLYSMRRISDLVFDKASAKELSDQARLNFFFILSSFAPLFLVLIIAFKIITEFFAYFHHHSSQNSIYRVLPTSMINYSSQHMNFDLPQQIKEVQTEGIIKLTLQKLSGTLFKIVKQENQPSQPETSKYKVDSGDRQIVQNQRLTNYQKSQIKVIPACIQTQEEEIENNFKQQQQPELESKQIEQKSVDSLSEIDKCIVCFDNTPNSVFHPCGHGGLCYECSIKILEKQKTCSLCRLPIKSVLKYEIQNKKEELMGKQSKEYQIISLSQFAKRRKPPGEL